MESLVARAAKLGIDSEYFDAHGKRQVVSDDALQKLAEALGGDQRNEGAGPSPALIWRQGRTTHLDVPNGVFACWKVMDGQKSIASGEGHSLALPADVPLGIFQLLLEIDGSETRRSTLIVAPEQAYQLDDAGADRIWVLAVQLYAVRSRRNWGHGDFTDLANLVRLAAEAGAAGIGLNPLHALFDDRPEHASPYSPNSRLFLNPLYIALDAVPEFRPPDVAGLQDALKGPRDAELVDYSTVAALKEQALRSAYQRFRKSRSAKRRADFKAFRLERGEALTRFAAFEVLRRRFQSVWWEWPAEWRQPTAEAIDRVRADAGDEMGYHEYVQWLADRQLAACQAEARRLGYAGRPLYRSRGRRRAGRRRRVERARRRGAAGRGRRTARSSQYRRPGLGTGSAQSSCAGDASFRAVCGAARSRDAPRRRDPPRPCPRDSTASSLFHSE